MDAISLITIHGCMFFVESNYPSDSLKSIEEIAQKTTAPPEALDADLFNIFLRNVQMQLDIVLRQVNVDHVFRVNR